jgi:hypothetical protein
VHDCYEFDSLAKLQHKIEGQGYYGGIRLLMVSALLLTPPPPAPPLGPIRAARPDQQPHPLPAPHRPSFDSTAASSALPTAPPRPPRRAGHVQALQRVLRAEGHPAGGQGLHALLRHQHPQADRPLGLLGHRLRGCAPAFQQGRGAAAFQRPSCGAAEAACTRTHWCPPSPPLQRSTA